MPSALARCLSTSWRISAATSATSGYRSGSRASARATDRPRRRRTIATSAASSRASPASTSPVRTRAACVACRSSARLRRPTSAAVASSRSGSSAAAARRKRSPSATASSQRSWLAASFASAHSAAGMPARRAACRSSATWRNSGRAPSGGVRAAMRAIRSSAIVASAPRPAAIAWRWQSSASAVRSWYSAMRPSSISDSGGSPTRQGPPSMRAASSGRSASSWRRAQATGVPSRSDGSRVERSARASASRLGSTSDPT